MKSKGISRQLLNSSAPWRSKKTPTGSVYRYQATAVSLGSPGKTVNGTPIRRPVQPPNLKRVAPSTIRYIPLSVKEPSILYMDSDLNCRTLESFLDDVQMLIPERFKKEVPPKNDGFDPGIDSLSEPDEY